MPADPFLCSLNSTFVRGNPIVEVDGHPLIDFKQCIRLAEQINSLVQYTPPRVQSATRPEVLAYVEYSLMSCVGNDVLRNVEARSAQLVGEELSSHDHQMRSLLTALTRVRYEQTAVQEPRGFDRKHQIKVRL